MSHDSPSRFLSACDVIDFNDSRVSGLARKLEGVSQHETIENCFQFVRDEVSHSHDAQANPVTVTASEVLLHRTGYCYAKSHLLAALLRSNGIPTALCYQRLTIDGENGPFCLHGLNAVYLKEHGWYRLDARGNRDGVNAQFTPPTESLAFPISHNGEYDVPGLFAKPLPEVIKVMRRFHTWDDLSNNLPDIDRANP